jgi:hypothetical protein
MQIEGFFGFKPDIGHLKLFGLRVCVKRLGARPAKLDRNNFMGIFLGYTATITTFSIWTSHQGW